MEEAHRVLQPGGRYGIHELALRPDDLSDGEKEQIQKELSDAIHVGARPLTTSEWRELLEAAGFSIVESSIAPMHLLRPARMINDEGLLGALRIGLNLARTPAARKRVVGMRRVFQKYQSRLCAIAIVARRD